MNAVNLVKLVELYKEILKSYVTDEGILIVQEEFTVEDIEYILLASEYVREAIRYITTNYLDKKVLVINGKDIDSLIEAIQHMFGKDNKLMFKTQYKLYLLIKQLRDKKQ